MKGGKGKGSVDPVHTLKAHEGNGSKFLLIMVYGIDGGEWSASRSGRYTYRRKNPVKGKSVPLQGLEWPRGFQEVKVPRFHDNGTGWW